MNELEKIDVNDGINIFESIKHIDNDGNEYWSARELQKALDYSQWRRFNETIERAKTACVNSGYNVANHFADVGKMVRTGDSNRLIEDYHLSRYACYLIAQNCDPRKKPVALFQNYIYIQTRKQELLEKYSNLR